MKKLFFYISALIILFILINCSSESDSSVPKNDNSEQTNKLREDTIQPDPFEIGSVELSQLCKNIINSLKNTDIKLYTEYVKSYYDNIIYYKESNLSESIKSEEIYFYESTRQEMEAPYNRRRLQEFLKISNTKFWNNAEVVKIEKKPIRIEDGIEVCSQIVVIFKGKRILEINGLIHFKQGWKFTIIRFV